MATAKNLILKPITAQEANAVIKRLHYSGKVVQNSQLHIGVYWEGRLEGALQFGPSLDKRKIMGLVKDTGWNEFLELNRMAFSDVLPRNSESRAMSIAFRLIKRHAPQIKWVISFADATQCGDGTIYRAAGFVLTAIKTNQQLYTLPLSDQLDVSGLKKSGWSDEEILWTQRWLYEITPKKLTVQDRPPIGAPHAHKMSLEGGVRPSESLSKIKMIMRRLTNGGTSADKFFRAIGGVPTKGFQLRYIYFIDPSFREKLTVPEIPFSRIKEVGAGMYRGKLSGESIDSDAPFPNGEGGASPTSSLQN